MTSPTSFTVTKTSDSLWRVRFENPPINLIDTVMVGELQDFLTEVEADALLAVVVFESADPEFFLSHWDLTAKGAGLDKLPLGPTGLHPWVDILIRLSKLPFVTITALRGRAQGAGSEFALATDIRFASREKAAIGQFELAVGAVAGGGPATRLTRLVGRGRALEIVLGAGDYDAETAAHYGYVNRAIPDAEFENFVDDFATRVSRFDVRAIQESKAFINSVSLPDNAEYAAQMSAFATSVSRPETRGRIGQLFELGLQQRNDFERSLGERMSDLVPPAAVPRGTSEI